jgi:glycosyltransferase involved in cell wall biosynthesis
VQAQTVREIEICVICDGSAENMVEFFNALVKEDPRINVFWFPKSPRTGEAHRDIVIRQKTQGKIICYCAHDDLWLPDHIEQIEKSLKSCCFTHTIQAHINIPDKINEGGDLFYHIGHINLGYRYFVDKMLAGTISRISLTNGAHTRQSYLGLKEGWATTPQIEYGTLINDKPIWFPTDLYMWNKFLRAYRSQCRTLALLTAINFPVSCGPRREWSEAKRWEELEFYFKKIQDPVFLEKIRNFVSDCYRRQEKHFLSKPRNLISVATQKIAGSLKLG